MWHEHTFVALVLSSTSSWVEDTTLLIVIFCEHVLALLKLLLSLNDVVIQLVVLRGHNVGLNGGEGVTRVSGRLASHLESRALLFIPRFAKV